MKYPKPNNKLQAKLALQVMSVNPNPNDKDKEFIKLCEDMLKEDVAEDRLNEK